MIYLVQTVSPTVCFLCSLSKEQKNGIKKKHERRSCRRLSKKHQARTENYLQKKVIKITQIWILQIMQSTNLY